MSTPMSADAWRNALRIEGVTKIVEMKSWKTHNRDGATGKAFGPVHGALIHHTAGVSSTMSTFVYNGTTALPGPLCHDFLAKDGTLYLVGHGRTNHAGTTTPAVRDAFIADKAPTTQRTQGSETVDANDFLYGLEIENKGDGKDPYPAVQYAVAVKWAAARLRYHGWTANSAWGHKEITTRKIDPSFDMVKFRKDVAAVLAVPAGKPVTPATPPKTTTPTKGDSVSLSKADLAAVAKAVLTTDGLVKAPSNDPNVKTNQYWQAGSLLSTSVANTNKLIAMVSELTAKVDALTEKVEGT